MKLSEVLSIENRNGIISIAGGGGKTSTMFTLAGELKNKRTLITTTTKILRPDDSPFYEVVTEMDCNIFLENLKGGKYRDHIVLGTSVESYPDKLVGKSLSFINKVKDFFQFTIVESDGSAGRPIKAPAEHEPVISGYTDIYIGIIGLDCLGKDGTDSYVHRPELYAAIRGKAPGEATDVSDFVKLINSPLGLFKNSPESCRKIVLINKSDLIDSSEGIKIIDRIFNECDFPVEVLLNTYREKESVQYYRR